METDSLKRNVRWSILVILAANVVFLVKDMADDIREGAGIWHIGPEVVVVTATVFTAVFVMNGLIRIREVADGFEKRMRELESENLDWRERTKLYAQGFSREIDRQFLSWGLSNAETEIALLLLKGLSNKEIAEVRATSEQTIKQQSSSIYRKSGLKTRSELSAFFLEDMLSPNGSYGSVIPTQNLSHSASPPSVG